MSKPITIAVIINKKGLSKRKMMEYWITNKEVIDTHIKNARKYAKRKLIKNWKDWMPFEPIVVQVGPVFDKNNNLIFEFYVEINHE